jgi:hypothetical protein
MSNKGMDPQKVLDYIKRSGALISGAEKRAEAEAKQASAVAALIPTVVDALISNGRIPEELRKKASEKLKEHANTLEILASVAAHRTDEETQHIGKPTTKSASARKSTFDSPYVGAVTTEERDSDIALLQRMGIR